MYPEIINYKFPYGLQQLYSEDDVTSIVADSSSDAVITLVAVIVLAIIVSMILYMYKMSFPLNHSQKAHHKVIRQAVLYPLSVVMFISAIMGGLYIYKNFSHSDNAITEQETIHMVVSKDENSLTTMRQQAERTLSDMHFDKSTMCQSTKSAQKSLLCSDDPDGSTNHFSMKDANGKSYRFIEEITINGNNTEYSLTMHL